MASKFQVIAPNGTFIQSPCESGALYRWPFSKAGEHVDVEVTGHLTMNDAGLTVQAALAGMGLACTHEGNITQALALLHRFEKRRSGDEVGKPFPTGIPKHDTSRATNRRHITRY
jgi:hypothetical protein